MRQNVNLLLGMPRRERLVLPAKTLPWIWLGVAVILLVIWLWHLWLVFGVRHELISVRAQVKKQQSVLVTMAEKATKTGSEQSLDAQVRLKKQLVALLDQKKRLADHGFSRYLLTLGEQVPQGVWLTHIDVNNENQTLSLQGKSINGSRVLQLVRRLNGSAVWVAHPLKLDSMHSAGSEVDQRPVLSFKVVTGNE